MCNLTNDIKHSYVRILTDEVRSSADVRSSIWLSHINDFQLALAVIHGSVPWYFSIFFIP